MRIVQARQVVLITIITACVLTSALWSDGVTSNAALRSNPKRGNAGHPIQPAQSVWEPVVLNAGEVEIRTWTLQGRTYAYVKLLFPNAGYRVADWGQPVKSGNDFSANAVVEKFTGASVQAVKTTTQIYDLGPNSPGNYSVAFKNSGVVVETLQFNVSGAAPLPNPIDDQRQFVRRQYLDFLNREPDVPGWDFWTDNITKCSDPDRRPPSQTEAQCISRQRETTSAAFFFSPEFQNTGYFVLRVYRGSLARYPFFGGSNPADPNKDEFTRDHAAVSAGIVVNNQLDPSVINANKQAFVNQFVTRAEFLAIYGSLNSQQYVDKLFETTGVSPTADERSALITGLTNNSETKATVLFKIVDGTLTGPGGILTFQTTYGKAFYDQQFNQAFVQMEYFGYLRRDPDDAGYAFWLDKLNHFGNFVDAEMVLAFISSPEYRERFGQASPSNQSPQVFAGVDQSIALPNTATLSGAVVDDGQPAGNLLVVSWGKISGPGSVIFSNASSAFTSAIFNTPGAYVLRLIASDGQFTGSDDVTITINPDQLPPPPDPEASAPPLDPNLPSTLAAGTRFLYEGSNPIQTGVAPGTISPVRVAVLRGKVLGLSSSPLSRVKVSILNHPEFGQTLTRADGAYDMAVNGGGLLTLTFERVGLITSQRQLALPWQDYVMIDDVMMSPYDDRVTEVDLSANTPIQVVQGSTVTDSSGSRRTVLMFKQGTSALMTLPNGSMQGLSRMHVRATEYTVGPTGPAAMPGDLPGTSAYTYAAEYSIDEAVAAPATDVSFNQPVAQYNENFLNFPVGTSIPSGSYDKANGIWMPSTNGLVIRLLSVTGGVANLDIDGSGNPASYPALTALGINTAEREQLASLYAVGQSLWRVSLNHFSSWDSNFAFGPPAGSGQSNGGSASGGGGGGNSGGPQGSGGSNGSNECPGCIVGIEDQRLSEEIDLIGTKYFLRYDSTRPRGNSGNYTARIPLSGPALAGPVKRIEMTLTIAGQMHEFTFPAQANQSTSFTWDGRDAYGRTVQGQQELSIDIGNVYDGTYQNAANFGYNGNGVPISVNTRQEITIHRRQRLLLGTYSAPPESLGGWSLSVNHAYDPIGKKLYEGNGKQRSVQTVSNGIDTFAGGLTGDLGDGGPVSAARFRWPNGIAVGPDGSVYVADSGNQRVRKIAPNGIVTTFAGNGGGCNPFNFPCGDGGPAANASFGSVNRVAVARDGSVYIGGGRNVWRVTPDGIFRRVAGIASEGFSGDGGPARDAQISGATRFYPAEDGSIYLSDQLNQRIRRIDPNGIITTIAGTGTEGFSSDGGPATQAAISYPGDIVAAPDGSVYFLDQGNNRIRRIASDGIITTYAGNGQFAYSGDGGPALLAAFVFQVVNPIVSGSMALAPDGSLYVVALVNLTGAARVRRIGPDGIVTAVAGSEQRGSQGDGGPALQAQLNLLALGLAPDNSIYVVGGGLGSDFDESRIRKVSPPLPGFAGTNIAIPSEDATQLFRFDADGRHLNTVNTLTGATVYTFGYDSAGRLTTVSDGDNNVTTIERDGSGNPTGIRSPYNQLTSFTRNGDGYLSTITNPANEQYRFSYNAGGQMVSERDPQNQQNIFTYDAMGRLIRDDDPAAGFQTLTRTDQNVNFTVARNTALNRQSSFQIQNLSNGDRRRLNTFPDGTTTHLLERANGVNTLTDPDGTITDETFSGDPRFKFQAPIKSKTTIATPGGLNYNATFARTATLSDPANLLSLTTESDTTNVNGRIVTSVFTASTRTFATTSAQNRTTSETIDAQGRLTQYQFADLNTENFTYDSQGRLSVGVVGTGGAARTFNVAYNPAGFRSSFANPLNQTTNLAYDLAGRVTQRTLADNRNIGFGYDPNGNLTSLTPPGRPAHTFTYTPVNLLSSYTAPGVGGNSTTSYEYNLDQQLTRITRPDALQTNYVYDNAGRLQTLTVPNGLYSYEYNATTGLLVSTTAPGGGVVTNQYDGFLLTRQTWTGTVAGNVSQTFDNNFRRASQSVDGANTINFSYDNDNLLTGAGTLTLVRSPQTGFITGSTLSNVNDTLTYNGFAEPTNYNAKFNATTFYDVNYTYDKLGRITQKVETIGGIVTTYAYGYDATGRLTTVTVNGGPQPMVAYTYDGNNNRLSINLGGVVIAGTYDAQDRMTQYGNTTYAYTLAGELQSKTNGGQTTQYVYDVVGNLRNVTLPNGTQIEYVIDGQNRRIGKKVNGTLLQGFLYQDQLEPVAELDGSNNLVSRFVYGSRKNTPDYMIKNGVTYRLITDHLGSVRLVVDVASGAIAQRIDYDEFGVVLSDTNPGFQPFGFAGGLYDAQTGLTRFGARDYDAETGRWTDKEPLLFVGTQTNLYTYAGNDPVNFLDPNGLDLIPVPIYQSYGIPHGRPIGDHKPDPSIKPPKEKDPPKPQDDQQKKLDEQQKKLDEQQRKLDEEQRRINEEQRKINDQRKRCPRKGA
jgi:RHS repeat-associated protein